MIDVAAEQAKLSRFHDEAVVPIGKRWLSQVLAELKQGRAAMAELARLRGTTDGNTNS